MPVGDGLPAAHQVRPRVPASCPRGFQGRYTVAPGDTMFTIAQRFRTSLSALIAANLHIPNPDLIFPGDVLCVPGQVPFPCCVTLKAAGPVPPGTSAAALAHLDFAGTQAVSVVATLPEPGRWGDFDLYVAEVLNPDVNGFGNQLFPTPEDPPTLATTISLPAAAFLSPDSRVVVRPGNSRTGVSGPVLLEGSLAQCRG